MPYAMLFDMCLPVCMKVLIKLVDENYFRYGSRVVRWHESKH